MRIQTLLLQNFRSYTQQTFVFGNEQIQVFLGENGAGKTNIIEAIHGLSIGKSCLQMDEQTMTKWGESYYKLRAELHSQQNNIESVECISQQEPSKQKVYFINDIKVSATKFIGTLPSLLFLPNYLDLFTGSPQLRRNLLDHLLCQTSSKYLINLVTYQKILKQRNALLRAIAKQEQPQTGLKLWDHQLAEVASQLTLERLQIIETLQSTIETEITQLGEKNWSNISLELHRHSTATSNEKIKDELIEALQKYRERDLATITTTVGPHREDWSLKVNQRNIATFASRGQQRTALLALLFIEVSYLDLLRSEPPIILLDDVFSELDDHHQNSLLESLQKYQVFITTTHLPTIKTNQVTINIHSIN